MIDVIVAPNEEQLCKNLDARANAWVAKTKAKHPKEDVHKNKPKPKVYEYKYEGVWDVYNKEAGKVDRQEEEGYTVQTEHSPEVWNKMEQEDTDEYRSTLMKAYD